MSPEATVEDATRGMRMPRDLVASLLPGLRNSEEAAFNVFDVMRHGTHEKQISNVFGWLLDVHGSHHLKDLFVRRFIEEVNRVRADSRPLGSGPYAIFQEVNTSPFEEGQDVADLVLESDRERVVIENYFTSDGHGHSFHGYLKFARRDGRHGAVVLLCQHADSLRQTEGWEAAPVLTYEKLVAGLLQDLPVDYQRKHPEAFSFINQMHRKFGKGRGSMDELGLINFVVAMCDNSQAGRYGQRPKDAAEIFAADVAIRAKETFADGRELLQRLKKRLKDYCDGVLRDQLNETMGVGFVRDVSSEYRGIYQWTINVGVSDDATKAICLKFGPSAWEANEQSTHWRRTEAADYAHILLGYEKELRQSAVTLQEVIDGLGRDDIRLHDEIVAFYKSPAGEAL